MTTEYEEYVASDVQGMFAELRPLFWYEAECLDKPLSWFFPGPGQSRNHQKGIEVCRGCPVRRECFDFAFDNRIEHGIWGGSGAEDRVEWFGDNISADEAWEQMIDGEIEPD